MSLAGLRPQPLLHGKTNLQRALMTKLKIARGSTAELIRHAQVQAVDDYHDFLEMFLANETRDMR